MPLGVKGWLRERSVSSDSQENFLRVLVVKEKVAGPHFCSKVQEWPDPKAGPSGKVRPWCFACVILKFPGSKKQPHGKMEEKCCEKCSDREGSETSLDGSPFCLGQACGPGPHQNDRGHLGPFTPCSCTENAAGARTLPVPVQGSPSGQQRKGSSPVKGSRF